MDVMGGSIPLCASPSHGDPGVQFHHMGAPLFNSSAWAPLCLIPVHGNPCVSFQLMAHFVLNSTTWGPPVHDSIT